jgi:hypothetical protein
MDLENIQEKLEILTKKWWFYIILLVATFFIPSFAEKPFSYEEIPNVIAAVLSQALTGSIILTVSIIFRILFIVFIVLIIVLKDKISRILNLFIATNYFFIALIQNIAYTDEYGMAFILGNLIIMLIVALFFIWEAIVDKTELFLEKIPMWRYWVIPFAVLAFWWPMDEMGNMSLNPLFFIMNVGMLAYCSVTPVYLAVLSLYHPKLNPATMRVASFVGIYFGFLNMMMWLPNPETLWLAILHIPLISISLYVFVLSVKL